MYPLRAPVERVRALFVEMLETAEHLRTRPEFYNTLTNNCTTRIRDHANRIASRPIPGGYKVLLPGYADELVLDLGLIDTGLDVKQARKRFQINEKAQKHADDPDFSDLIRADGP
jgi:hypothetical protein